MLITIFLILLSFYIIKKIHINNLYSCFVFQPPNENFFKTAYNQRKNYYFINSKNGKKISYFEYKPHTETNKIIIWSHGNAMNSYQMSEYYDLLSNELNVNIIAYDYQGYGLSEGYYSEKNCYDDLESIIQHVKEKYETFSSNIYLVGHSLGTGVVIDYASKNNWLTPIMLISPYKSILRIVLSYFGEYLGFMDMFNSIKKINKVKCPVKIIHGEKDELIHIIHGRDLYEKLYNKSLNPLWLKYCGHNNIIERIEVNIFKETFNL